MARLEGEDYSSLFADDTALILQHENEKNFGRIIESKLEKYINWFKANRLAVNMTKTIIQ